MSRTTTNLNLIKPELTDAADITSTNSNWDKIDDHLGYLAKLLPNKPSVVPVASGGTGATNANEALKNLGLTNLAVQNGTYPNMVVGKATSADTATKADKATLATKATVLNADVSPLTVGVYASLDDDSLYILSIGGSGTAYDGTSAVLCTYMGNNNKFYSSAFYVKLASGAKAFVFEYDKSAKKINIVDPETFNPVSVSNLTVAATKISG